MKNAFTNLDRPGSVHIIDSDELRRAAISRQVFDENFHAEIYEDIRELVRHCPKGGFVLMADEVETDSVSCLEAIESSCGYFPVALYSANPLPHRIVRAIAGGAVDYVQWPFLAGVLWDTIAGLHRHGEHHGRIESQKAEARQLAEKLTGRERDVLDGLVAGGSNKDLARALGISSRTVEIHRANMMTRLNAQSVADAVRIAIYAGIDGSAHPLD